MGNSNSTLKLGNEKLLIKKILSTGRNSTTYLTEQSSSSTLPHNLVCKRFELTTSEMIGKITDEISLLSLCTRTPNIIQYYGYTQLTDSMLLFSEYCPYTIDDAFSLPIPEETIIEVFHGIASALAFLHSQKPSITYFNLRKEHVLLSEDYTVKLCDFGSAQLSETFYYRKPNDHQIIKEFINNNVKPEYQSPEMILLYENQPISRKSDIWALGCLLFETAIGTPPFSAPLCISDVKQLDLTDYQMSKRMKSLLKEMLVFDQNKRPNIYTILEHFSQVVEFNNPYKSFMKETDDDMGSTQSSGIKTPSSLSQDSKQSLFWQLLDKKQIDCSVEKSVLDTFNEL
ncbi:protein kinase domain containing protein [Entamoeba histolytica HM-1:IMSS-B]|uniref:non-specific serine/threonine protein kinase n=6 Tax=Entamoeba histolytica TaxID=5759 RepID=C4M453_ENTH1|nr:protein kinase domain containing protein [Entamoeba histolytica HM-1:IMSS]EMD49080.1 serine/threonine protein kinase ULK3, putative [Entamoeba histolytica KU27]EMH74679.1 protein kinase domain containing protein [Entamoeba histolytica HM-1:IMSS-B]EMS16352.1 serine/threonine protein kinase ULK3, putative [Entamoeba histolytica HM-3:IMSS]ENY61464.1 serine/threonine protein kinase ULK3, putative [Entamoeba histolytica HM-1:IMSS-A]GAT96130.1 protein kinase domain containing protein [Entamoeba h|eukprot:XP_649819.1 protein kinase domain containing protein [Entamoeba histolytica HM-1:IMSS]